jgi:hypothetical protein
MGAKQIGKKNKKYFSISLKRRHYRSNVLGQCQIHSYIFSICEEGKKRALIGTDVTYLIHNDDYFMKMK